MCSSRFAMHYCNLKGLNLYGIILVACRAGCTVGAATSLLDLLVKRGERYVTTLGSWADAARTLCGPLGLACGHHGDGRSSNGSHARSSNTDAAVLSEPSANDRYRGPRTPRSVI